VKKIKTARSTSLTAKKMRLQYHLNGTKILQDPTHQPLFTFLSYLSDLSYLLLGGSLTLLVIQGHLVALLSMAILWGLHSSFAGY